MNRFVADMWANWCVSIVMVACAAVLFITIIFCGGCATKPLVTLSETKALTTGSVGESLNTLYSDLPLTAVALVVVFGSFVLLVGAMFGCFFSKSPRKDKRGNGKSRLEADHEGTHPNRHQ